MKTLGQIEPRTPISSTPFTISASGSYYLTTNVTVSAGDAITIDANNVTLDLNGFTVSSTQNPATTNLGILLGGNRSVTNVTIVNGFISSGVTNNNGMYSGSGFGYGISGWNFGHINVRAIGVSVSGCLNNGIDLGLSSSVVESCTVCGSGFNGISAESVYNSTARDCGYYGIYAAVANNCSSRGDGNGMFAFTANNCSGYSVGANGGFGVYAYTASNCYGYVASSGIGIYATIAIGCSAYSINGTGLSAYIANSCSAATTFGSAENVTYKYNMP